MTRYLKFICLGILLLVFSACADLNSIFSGEGQTSYHPDTSSKGAQKKHQEEPISKTSDVSVSPEGGRLPIVTKQGTYYFINPGDSLDALAKRYNVKKSDLAQINNLYDSDFAVGRRLFIPNSKTREEFLTVTNIIREKKLAQDLSLKSVTFAWPVKEGALTSGFGWRHGRHHDGQDISAPVGTPVYAAADGKVIYGQRFAGYGNLLVIKHAKKYFTAYAHLNSVSVEEDKEVKQGQQIGTVGNTGRSTGPHLHFEIHKGAVAVDPLSLLPENSAMKKVVLKSGRSKKIVKKSKKKK